jgi:RNA polymerase sigma-70 factor (ECF subfamily)
MQGVCLRELISSARDGDAEALGMLLERERATLRVLAQRAMDARLSRRVDPSDVVQQTFLEAQRDFVDFRGKDGAEWDAWLQQILEHNVSELVEKHIFARKRRVNAERSLDDSKLHRPALRDILAADGSSPSHRSIRAEDAAQMAEMIQTLPNDQREAMRLRYLEGRSLQRMADHFGRSQGAVAGLLRRGLQQLRSRFQGGP